MHNFFRMYGSATEEARYRDKGPEMRQITALLSTMLSMGCTKVVVRRFDTETLRRYAQAKSRSTFPDIKRQSATWHAKRWTEITAAIAECSEYNKSLEKGTIL